MFQALEYIFQVLEYLFQDLEYDLALGEIWIVSLLNENWDVGFVDRSRDGLSTSIVLARSIVRPTFFVLGQVGLPLFDTRLCDGTDE